MYVGFGKCFIFISVKLNSKEVKIIIFQIFFYLHGCYYSLHFTVGT